jgi:hypothetical protein
MLGNGRSQRRLAMVNVADGTHVHMRLRPLKLLLGHCLISPSLDYPQKLASGLNWDNSGSQFSF